MVSKLKHRYVRGVLIKDFGDKYVKLVKFSLKIQRYYVFEIWKIYIYMCKNIYMHIYVMKQLIFLRNMLFLLEFFLCLLILWCHFIYFVTSTFIYCVNCLRHLADIPSAYVIFAWVFQWGLILRCHFLSALSTFTYCVNCLTSLCDLMNHIDELSIYCIFNWWWTAFAASKRFNYVFLMNVFNYVFLISVF